MSVAVKRRDKADSARSRKHTRSFAVSMHTHSITKYSIYGKMKIDFKL